MVHDKSWRAKSQRALVVGEECYFLSIHDKWKHCIITGTRDSGRSYDILTEKGTSIRRNRSHLKPKSYDIPAINSNFHSSVSLQDHYILPKMKEKHMEEPLAVLPHPPKDWNNSSISGPSHPPKIKITLKRTENTASYRVITEPLVPLKCGMKAIKKTRFKDDPVTSVRSIPARLRWHRHPQRCPIDASDSDLLIPIEMSSQQGERTGNNSQDLGEPLSDVVASPPVKHPPSPSASENSDQSDSARSSTETTTTSIETGCSYEETTTSSQSLSATSSRESSLLPSTYSGYSSSRKSSWETSPETQSNTVSILYSPTLEMKLADTSLHIAIHSICDMHERAVMRNFLKEQKTQARSKMKGMAEIASPPEFQLRLVQNHHQQHSQYLQYHQRV